MRIIKNHSEIDATAWKKLVDSSPVATWFQTLEAYDFFASLPSMMTPFVFAVESNEKLKGLVVGYITREKNPIKQFFTRRAIIYGGPLLSEDISDEELKSLLFAICSFLKSKAIYIETRNFNDYNKWRNVFEQSGFTYQPHYDMHIDCGNYEKMISRIDERKYRQVSKEINEVEFTEAHTINEIKDFYLLLSDLYHRKVHTPLFPIEFFTAFVQQKRGVLLLVKRLGKVIGGMLCPMIKGKVIYEWFVVGPAVVTWSVMDYANKNHFPLFDLMGAGKPDIPYGVRDFKMQFGGELKEYGRYLMINNKCLYNIGKIGVDVMKRS